MLTLVLLNLQFGLHWAALYLFDSWEILNKSKVSLFVYTCGNCVRVLQESGGPSTSSISRMESLTCEGWTHRIPKAMLSHHRDYEKLSITYDLVGLLSQQTLAFTCNL